MPVQRDDGRATPMAKYKLEYIWLDGYEPVPNLRGKTKVKEFDGFPKLEELPDVGLRRQLDAPGRRQQLGLHAEAGRGLSRSDQEERRARHVRSAHARRHAASEQQPRDDPGRSRYVVRFRAGILPLPGRRAARASPPAAASRRRRASTTPASATRTSARSRARSSIRTSTSASRPASTTKASTPKWPRASGNSRSSARARRAPPTRCGSPATSSSASARSTAST